MRFFYLLCGLLLATGAQAQSRGTVTGRVTDSRSGDPLPGANIVVAGTATGTTTDTDGRYRLASVSSGTATLVVQFIGYATQRRTVEVPAGGSASADIALVEGAVNLDEVTVKGEGFRPDDAAATANVVTAEDMRRFAGDNPLRLLDDVPGVDIGGYRQGGTADVFSIRGFGGGGHEGDVAVQIDGIPLNEADGHEDGYADLNVIVPLELQRLVVYKGPSSALYGNFARGGTVALDTRHGGQYRDVSLSGGAYRTLDAQFALGERFDVGGRAPLETNLAVQFFTTDGYAANSRYLKGTVAGRASYAITPRTGVNVSLRGHSGEWGAPGYIPEEQFLDESRRREQALNGERDGGIKSFYAERVGLNHSFSDDLRLVSFAYAVQQDFTRFSKSGGTAPGGQREYGNEREVYGTGASLNGRAAVGGAAVTYVGGAEYYSETTEARRWNTANRVRQQATQAREFLIQNAAAFVQAEIALSPYLRPTLALRYDRFFGSYANNDPGATASKSDLNNLSHLSPKIGVRSQVMPGLDLRASATNGYVLPNGADKYDATLSVDPVEIWQYEVGANAVVAERLTLDLAGYMLDTTGEILESPPGSGTFENFGETRRRGLEASATLRAGPGLRATGALGLVRSEVRRNPDAARVGKQVTGVPSRTLSLSLDYVSPMGFGGRAHLNSIGSYFLNAANDQRYEGYDVVDLTVFYDLGARAARRGRLFVQADNLFDTAYAEAVFISGGVRTYAPAPPRRISAGIQIGL